MERNKKKEYIQNAIIDGIFALLLEKNWESLSSNEICEKAGVSKRTLYAYYCSQDEMYLELVKRSFERMNIVMQEAMKDKRGYNLDYILCLGETYIKFMLENPREGALILGFDEKKYQKQYEKQVNEIHLIANRFELKHLFQELQLDPQVFDGTMAIYLWAHIQGIAQLLHSKGEWMEDYYGISIENIIQGQMKLTRQMLGGLYE
ncbi:TetR/AcrR family transcriptional regulator [Anaerotignum sp.]|uniref:TetR/AcrR family transcriptional regulator n=1 Tax=Anaerotignum sp. TaxID=2039241 RepID=UPI0028A24B0C|nr:TetR/AcrR family transcriptional regulator [Anaerotignum sp.]